MKRGALALAAAVALTGATLATASASGTTNHVATTTPVVTIAPTASLLLPNGPGAESSPVLSYSGGISTGASGKAVFANLTITRAVDGRTPFLTQSVGSQRPLAKGVALVVTPRDSTHASMRITLGGATVASDQYSGSAAGTPTESVSFRYASIQIEYFTPNGKGGFNQSLSCWNADAGASSCPSPVL